MLDKDLLQMLSGKLISLCTSINFQLINEDFRNLDQKENLKYGIFVQAKRFTC